MSLTSMSTWIEFEVKKFKYYKRQKM